MTHEVHKLKKNCLICFFAIKNVGDKIDFLQEPKRGVFTPHMHAPDAN